MTIKDMHYDFKKKLNKVDSQKYRNLLVPEIDWVLNEGYQLYVKIVLQPKRKDFLGSHINQRTLDDLYTIIKHESDSANCYTIVDNVVDLPFDYWYYLSGNVNMSKGSCENVQGKVFIRQHEDEFERSVFDKSSFEWRTVNAVYTNRGIKFYTSDFTVDQFCLSYIKSLRLMHNAENFRSGNYALPSGQLLGVSTGGGKLEILNTPTLDGVIDITIDDGSSTDNITLSVVVGESIKSISERIVEAIRQGDNFEAFYSNTIDHEINITGPNPITTVTFTDTGTTGVAANTSENVEIGERSLDCELPEHTHREIVDLAVLITTGELGNGPDYSFKQEKIKMNLNL